MHSDSRKEMIVKYESRLSRKHNVSIPKAVREEMSWRPGQKLVFIPKGNGVLMMSAPEIEDLFGIARGADLENYRDRNESS
jgi:AbrB family looped-hinge helix DNA binding protein